MARASVLPRLPKRPRNTHKGDYGHVLVVAGAVGYSGAACLTAQAALRTGSGLVTLVVPKSIYHIVAVKLTEVIVVPAPDTPHGTFGLKSLSMVRRLLASADVLAIGPGFTTYPSVKLFFRRLLPLVECPVVIDADALNLLSRSSAVRRKIRTPAVLTPHPGEMARLMGVSPEDVQRSRRSTAEALARELGVVVALKGYRTVVTNGRQTSINQTGNTGMATAGSGDVLTGMIASLIGQGMDVFQSTRLGVYLHGLAGDLSARTVGEQSLLAGDLLCAIPEAFKSYLKRRRS